MKVFNKISVYAGDVSGVCSALYELGGMVVIHDPSGCNSTYNTHDEIRWYDHPSQIFISGLKESDALLGHDQILIDETIEAAKQMKPAFIALVNSPVPYLNGTDMAAIAKKVEKETGIRCFYIPTNAFHDYSAGIAQAMKALAENLSFEKGDPIKNAINILGVTPLDYTDAKTVTSMKRNLSDFTVLSTWLKDATLSDLKRSLSAQANLVVSSSGLSVAKWMFQNYGIPYVIGVPLMQNKNEIAEALIKAIETGDNQSVIKEATAGDDLVLIGEPVLSECLGQILSSSYRVICSLEIHRGILRKGDLYTRDEKEISAALNKGKRVIGDPIYKRVTTSPFKELPHLALSGRLYLNDMKDVCAINFE